MKKSFVNYAHRGASHYAPENTMMAFRLGLQMGANGIETDVQRTKDGVLVLFHDDTLNRVTGAPGSVGDYTLAELGNIWVRKDDQQDKIPTFQEFLDCFGAENITLAIELKQEDTYRQTADIIQKSGAADRCIVTSFLYSELEKLRGYAPNLQAGYLTSQVTPELLQDMKEKGITQLCPKADLICPQRVQQWHEQGFSVRAWGVSDEETMIRVYDSGADGMTVNFPDRLRAYMEKRENG